MRRFFLVLVCAALTGCMRPDPEVPCVDSCRMRLRECRNGLTRNVDSESTCMDRFRKCQAGCD